MIGIVVVVVLVVVLALGAVFMHNRMVSLDNRVGSAWSQVDVELSRRSGMVPQLVEIVRRYAAHERGSLEAATTARVAAESDALDAATNASATRSADGGPMARGETERTVQATLRSLLAVAESYPTLLADRSFSRLRSELSATEDRVASSRDAYNEAVLALNTALETFPMVLMARPMGLSAREYLTEDRPTATSPGLEQDTPTG